MKVLIRQYQCPGDLLMLSAAIRDLKAVKPLWQVNVQTSCDALFDHNPRLDRTVTEGNADRIINLEYPQIHESDKKPFHFVHAFRRELEEHFGIIIPQGAGHGEVFLSEDEKRPVLPGDYWLVNAGYKNDFPLKNWGFEHYQEVVDRLRGEVQFVQIGALEHNHRRLSGVTDMVGKTSVRGLISLVYFASGVLTPVSFPMHLCAAVPAADGAIRPCVVVAGGREPNTWEQYLGHQFLHAVGALDCCRAGGCWKSQTGDCLHPAVLGNEVIGKCMMSIAPERVAEIIKLYNRE